eukprot:1976236-Prymnesium_polylepis.1
MSPRRFEKDVADVECGAVGAAVCRATRRTSPAAPRLPPRPLARPCPSPRRRFTPPVHAAGSRRRSA